MKTRVFMGFVSAVVATLLLAGCSQPAAAPTQAPPASTKAPATVQPASALTQAVEPTKPAAAAPTPTVASAATTGFPEKGKSVSLIIPWPAGGGADVAARVLAVPLEKELGVPVQIVNKGGAGSQVGLSDLAVAKPDGYTICYANLPTTPAIYFDEERKAVFARKDFQTVALHSVDPYGVGVKASSPYKSIADLVEAAKVNPEKVKIGVFGRTDPGNMAAVQLQQASSTKFATVMFDGAAPTITAVLGGHVDAAFVALSPMLAQVKSGELRVIGVMDKEESPFAKGVKTLDAQGYKIFWVLSRGVVAPGGTPKPAVDALSAAIKRAMQSGDHNKKMEEMFQVPKYLDATQYGAYWDESEASVKPLMQLVR